MAQLPSLSKTIEKLTQQITNLNDAELEKFYEKILKTTNEVENLCELFIMLHYSTVERRLPSDVSNALLAAICNLTSSSRIINLCLLILGEASPLSTSLDDILDNLGQKSKIKLLSLLPLQKKEVWKNVNLISGLLNYLKGSLQVSEHMVILIYITRFMSTYDLTPEKINFLNGHFIDIFSKACVYQAPNPYSNALFKKTETKELVTELDGKPMQDIFTILNLAKYNSDDQFMNICSFCLMKEWLSYILEQNKADVLSRQSVSGLIQSIREYCIRVISQTQYAVQNRSDKELQRASAIEAISILDLICKFEPSNTVPAFNCVKWLSSKINLEYENDSQLSIVFTYVLQFLLHHGETVGFDVKDLLHNFFTIHIPLFYRDIIAAFEYVNFLHDNRLILSEKFDSFTKYFPSILKILAWYPKTFLEDFVEFLPLFICDTTAVEVFHTILDLPCLTASLIISKQESSHSIAQTVNVLRKKLYENEFKSMVAFMMRSTSGVGDTFDKLKTLHVAMECINDDLRIISCSELVPLFINLNFNKIHKLCKEKIKHTLITSILERVNVIYNVPGLIEAAQKALADQMINIFKLHPYLAVDNCTDLLEYASHTFNVERGCIFYMNLIWIIGEYVTLNFHPNCTPQLIIKNYEVIECISYEIVTSLKTLPLALKMMTIVATTLSKLATRNQDLISRAKLCLSKMIYSLSQSHLSSSSFSYEEIEIATDRITELIAILQTPNIASIVLNPPSDLNTLRLHEDDLSVPFILNSISTMFD